MPLHGHFLLPSFVYRRRRWSQVHAPALPICTDGSKSSEGVGCAAVFHDFDVFISLPSVLYIFTVELCVIFLALTRISFHDSATFVICSDFRSAGAFIHTILWSLVLKIQRFLCDLPQDPLPCGALAKRALQLLPANHCITHSGLWIAGFQNRPSV